MLQYQISFLIFRSDEVKLKDEPVKDQHIRTRQMNREDKGLDILPLLLS